MALASIPPRHRSRLQGEFEAGAAFFHRFLDGFHQDAAQSRRRQHEVWHFEDTRLADYRLGQAIENWGRRRRAPRKLKNPGAGFRHAQVICAIGRRLDQLFFRRQSEGLLHRNREPAVDCGGRGLDRGPLSGPGILRRAELQLQRRIARRAGMPARPVVVHTSRDFIAPRVEVLRRQGDRPCDRGATTEVPSSS